jgi:hypothetical protein
MSWNSGAGFLAVRLVECKMMQAAMQSAPARCLVSSQVRDMAEGRHSGRGAADLAIAISLLLLPAMPTVCPARNAIPNVDWNPAPASKHPPSRR